MRLRLKEGFKYGILPFLGMLVSMCFCIVCFRLCRKCNCIEFQQVVDIAGEETNATYGRFIFLCLSFCFCTILTVIAAKMLKKNGEEKLMLPWILSTAAGVLLWQCIGESVWHYGLDVIGEDGESCFVNFSRIESIQGLPLLIVVIVLYFIMYGKVSFAYQACLGAFIGNWYGHICMLGSYPFAMAMGTDMDSESWYRLSGAVNGVAFLFIGLYLMYSKKTDKKTKYLASICLFISYGAIVYGAIRGGAE